MLIHAAIAWARSQPTIAWIDLMGGVSRCKAGFEPLAGEHCKNLEL